MPRRSLAAAILAGVLLALTCSAARADGDPASDTLIFQNVFLPYPTPPKEITKPLAAAVSDVYAKSYRVKVAVIASPQDLGAVLARAAHKFPSMRAHCRAVYQANYTAAAWAGRAVELYRTVIAEGRDARAGHEADSAASMPSANRRTMSSTE